MGFWIMVFLSLSNAEGSQGVSWDGFESVIPFKPQGVISKACR